MKELIYDELEDYYDGVLDTPLSDDYDLVLLAVCKTWCNQGVAIVNISEREDYQILGDAITKHLLVNTESYITAYKDAIGITTYETHHDATNIYLYRYVKKGCDFSKLEQKLLKAKDGHQMRDILNRHSVTMWMH